MAGPAVNHREQRTAAREARRRRAGGAAHGAVLLCRGLSRDAILTESRGTGGFGCDLLFFSTDLGMIFGEAAPAAKHRVSHRKRAFRALIEVLLWRSK
jgi:inosine/xanthosine triphosphate pyrophosphatase family protein